MSSVNTSHLEALAVNAATKYVFDKVSPDLLERFECPFRQPQPSLFPVRGQSVGQVHIEAPEFTSLCPMTGQPDFATIVVDYVPNLWCVESKSFKLYLMSFRNVGEFHEACINRIANDLIELLDPEYLKVVGLFTPRGGIPFQPSVEYAATSSNPSFGG